MPDMGEVHHSVWMQDLRWEEVSDYLKRDQIAVLPVGSTEQHGPAGPLGVDTYVAITLAEDVAERSGVLCAPPLWFGDSSHHMAFPGTISIGTETLLHLIQDVCRSLARHGFDRIVLINGHKGSNLAALNSAVRALHEHELPRVLFAVADPLHLARSVAPSIKETNEHHAGELELSHIVYRYPGLVRTDLVTDEHADFDRVFGGFVGNDLFGPPPDGVEIAWSGAEEREFAPGGSLSASTGVSVDKGQAYHDHIVDRLCDLVAWLRRYDGPIGRRKP
jgi:creatinine amidohydrolase